MNQFKAWVFTILGMVAAGSAMAEKYLLAVAFGLVVVLMAVLFIGAISNED